MPFIEISHLPGSVPVTVLRLLDRIHLGNFAELERTAKAAHANGARRLIMDLSRIESLTSIGVRAVVVVHKLLAADGGRNLKLAGVSSSMRDVLEIAGITQFVELYNTVEEAAASF